MTTHLSKIQLVQQVKNELEKLPHNQYWQIPRDGAQYIYDTILKLKPKTILEIGTSSGYSALWMAEALLTLAEVDTEQEAHTEHEAHIEHEAHTDQATQTGASHSQIITVESHQQRHDFAKENFQKAQVTDLIHPVKGHAPQIFSEIQLPVTIDLAFFDGTKSQTTDFFTSIWELLAPNGIILVDNVLSHQEKMQPFLDYLTENNITHRVLDIGAGICKIRK